MIHSRMFQSTIVLGVFLMLYGQWSISTVEAQTWAQTIDGTDHDRDRAWLGIYTSDGNYVMAGETYFSSYGRGLWVIKQNNASTIIWQRFIDMSLPGSDGFDAAELTNGNYLVAYYDYNVGFGDWDIFLVLLDPIGTVLWQKIYGGAGDDKAFAVKPTTDGGAVIAGSTTSFGAGGKDFLVFKIDSAGTVEWKRVYGGSANDVGSDVLAVSEGGYLIAGQTESFGLGFNDYLLIKTDTNGNIEWSKTYGTSSFEDMPSIARASDGGYVLVCTRLRYIKTDSNGVIESAKQFYSYTSTYRPAVAPTYDGGAIIANKSNFASQQAGYILQLDSEGNSLWQRTYYDGTNCCLYDITQTSDGGFFAVGASNEGASAYDAVSLKLDRDGNIPGVCSVLQTKNETPLNYTPTTTVPTLSMSNPLLLDQTISTAVADTSAGFVQQCADFAVFSVYCDQTAVTIDQDNQMTFGCTVSALNWSGSVSLSCTGLPAGTSGEFETNPIVLEHYESFETDLTISVGPSQDPGVFPFTVDGQSGALLQSFYAILTVPQFDIEPKPLAFGGVPLGTHLDQTLAVSNIGTSPVTIAAVSSPAAPFSIIANNCTGTTIPTGLSCAIKVRFEPLSAGSFSSVITVSSDTPESLDVPLSGHGVTPTISLTTIVPNGGESWEFSPDPSQRKMHVLVWDYDYFLDLTRTQIHYSADAGNNWTCLADSAFDNYTATSVVPIPDNDPEGASSTINVVDTLTVSDVNVIMTIVHPRVEDLVITLRSPQGTTITLSDGVGVAGSSFSGTILSDHATCLLDEGSSPYMGFYHADAALGSFNAEMSNGTWTLMAVDQAMGETGAITEWTINFSDCHNRNILGTDVLLPSSSNFDWIMPTESEAMLLDNQTIPSAKGRIRIDVWGEGGSEAWDTSDNNFYLVRPSTSSIRTLIVWNSHRFCDRFETNGECQCDNGADGPDCTVAPALKAKLEELARHDKVVGVVLDLAAVPVIEAAYADWDSNPLVQSYANNVASAIRAYLLTQVQSTYTNTGYIILVGDDQQIPFFRIVDGTIIYPENLYPTEVSLSTSTALGSALNQGYFLSDNFYAEESPEKSGLLSPHENVYLHDFALGRLVESPEQITEVINTFLSHAGQVDLTKTGSSVLVTGFDFFADSSRDIAAAWRTRFATDCLIDDPDLSGPVIDCVDEAYTPTELENELFSTPTHLINVLQCHANHSNLTASTGSPNVLSTSTMSSNPVNLRGTIVYSSGCHTGLPVPESEIVPLDIPELMARKEVLAHIGNTGYGWGIHYGIGLTEKLMMQLNNEVLGSNSISIGSALARAKRNYFLQEKRYDVFDEKVLHQATLFGIPNTLLVTSLSKGNEVNSATTLDIALDRECDGGICLDRRVERAGTSAMLPPGMTMMELNFEFGASTYQLVNTTDGDYYTLNDKATGEVGDTIQPMFAYNSNLSGTVAHGVVFTGGAYQTESPFTPVIAVPHSTNFQGSGGNMPLRMTLTPSIQVATTYNQGTQKTLDKLAYTNLIAQTGYYDETTQTELRFDTMQFVIYYSNEVDSTRPVIEDPGPDGFHTLNGLTATYSVQVTDDTGVFRVLVTFEDQRNSQWDSHDLSYNPISSRWEGTFNLKGDIVYFVQAIDTAGNVEILSESGDDLGDGGVPYGSQWKGPKTYAIHLVDNDEGIGDGLPDAWEELYPCMDKANKNDVGSISHTCAAGPDPLVDPDGDCLSNIQEFLNDCHPCQADSDGGGDNDGSEINNGRNIADWTDDLALTITMVKDDPTSTYTINWNDGLGHNDQIDGYYYLYRADSPHFGPADLVIGILDDQTTSYEDVSPPCNPCFYNVWNYELTTSPPAVQFVTPDNGTESGGVTVEIFGKYFTPGAVVTFCDVPATGVMVVSPNYLYCINPAHESSLCNVTVINPNGQSGTLPQGFEYY